MWKAQRKPHCILDPEEEQKERAQNSLQGKELRVEKASRVVCLFVAV